MRKAIFLDRDGTINVEKDYLYKIEDFQFETGALKGLKIFKELGYIVIVVTNQSGIARGYYTEEELIKLNEYMMLKVKENGGEISKCYFCPHHLEKGINQYRIDCNCRKPNIGMLEKGKNEFNIDMENSYIVGDKISDINAGIKAGLTPILVKTGYGRTTMEKENITCEVYDNLGEFAMELRKKGVK